MTDRGDAQKLKVNNSSTIRAHKWLSKHQTS